MRYAQKTEDSLELEMRSNANVAICPKNWTNGEAIYGSASANDGSRRYLKRRGAWKQTARNKTNCEEARKKSQRDLKPGAISRLEGKKFEGISPDDASEFARSRNSLKTEEASGIEKRTGGAWNESKSKLASCPKNKTNREVTGKEIVIEKRTEFRK